MSSIRQVFILILWIFVSFTTLTIAQDNEGKSLDDFVTSDGRFDLDMARRSGFQGSLDMVGFVSSIDPITGEPFFRPSAANNPDEHPDDIYWDNTISPSLPGVDRSISALTVFEGSLIVGGVLTIAGSVNARAIAARDGTSWSAFGSGINDPVNALAVYKNKLMVGGYFTTAGEKVSAYLAQWTKIDGCCIVFGDANDDGEYNITDAVYIVNHVFRDGNPPICSSTCGETSCS